MENLTYKEFCDTKIKIESSFTKLSLFLDYLKENYNINPEVNGDYYPISHQDQFNLANAFLYSTLIQEPNINYNFNNYLFGNEINVANIIDILSKESSAVNLFIFQQFLETDSAIYLSQFSRIPIELPLPRWQQNNIGNIEMIYKFVWNLRQKLLTFNQDQRIIDHYFNNFYKYGLQEGELRITINDYLRKMQINNRYDLEEVIFQLAVQKKSDKPAYPNLVKKVSEFFIVNPDDEPKGEKQIAIYRIASILQELMDQNLYQQTCISIRNLSEKTYSSSQSELKLNGDLLSNELSSFLQTITPYLIQLGIVEDNTNVILAINSLLQSLNSDERQFKVEKYRYIFRKNKAPRFIQRIEICHNINERFLNYREKIQNIIIRFEKDSSKFLEHFSNRSKEFAAKYADFDIKSFLQLDDPNKTIINLEYLASIEEKYQELKSNFSETQTSPELLELYNLRLFLINIIYEITNQREAEFFRPDQSPLRQRIIKFIDPNEEDTNSIILDLNQYNFNPEKSTEVIKKRKDLIINLIDISNVDRKILADFLKKVFREFDSNNLNLGNYEQLLFEIAKSYGVDFAVEHLSIELNNRLKCITNIIEKVFEIVKLEPEPQDQDRYQDIKSQMEIKWGEFNGSLRNRITYSSDMEAIRHIESNFYVFIKLLPGSRIGVIKKVQSIVEQCKLDLPKYIKENFNVSSWDEAVSLSKYLSTIIHQFINLDNYKVFNFNILYSLASLNYLNEVKAEERHKLILILIQLVEKSMEFSYEEDLIVVDSENFQRLEVTTLAVEA